MPLENNDIQSPLFHHPSHSTSTTSYNTEVDNLVGSLVSVQDDSIWQPINVEEVVQRSTTEPLNSVDNNNSTNYNIITLLPGNGSTSYYNDEGQQKADTSQESTYLLHSPTRESEEKDPDFKPTSGSDSDDSEKQEEPREEEINSHEVETVAHVI